MADTRNLMGLNLSVNEDLIADAVRESIVASIAASLSNSDKLVAEFVKQMLTRRVRTDDGTIPRYSSDKTCTYMEYLVRKAIEEQTRAELVAMIDEQKPQLRKAIQREFQNKKMIDGFVGMFFDALKGTIDNNYTCKVHMDFTKSSDY